MSCCPTVLTTRLLSSVAVRSCRERRRTCRGTFSGIPSAWRPKPRCSLFKGLADIRQRVFVDARALVVTPWHRAINRLEEFVRAGNRHGSCGEGIGEVVSDRESCFNVILRAKDLKQLTQCEIERLLDRHAQLKRERWLAINNQCLGRAAELVARGSVAEDLRFLLDPEAPANCARLFKRLASQVQIVDDDDVYEIFNEKGDVIFEGAQGVLIDESHGFAPYHTWSNCTSDNAMEILSDVDWASWHGKIEVTGVLRAYAIRHGVGPFVTECQSMTNNPHLRELHNDDNLWQGKPRLGDFDAVASHYALKADGRVDSLAITCLDRLRMENTLSEREFGWKICTGYEWPGDLGPVTFEPGWSRFGQAAKLLAETRPVYGATGKGSAEFLHRISCLLDRPISIESRGPTYHDKTFNEEFDCERVA